MADDPRNARAASAPLEVSVVDGLRESEARFRALAEHARDVILEITSAGRVVYVSPSARELFGYEPTELVGRNALELVHPEDLPEVDAIRATVFGRQTSAVLSFRLLRADGGWSWVELSGRAYTNPEGELRGVLVARDVSDRVAVEHTLKSQLQQEGRMADLARGFMHLSLENFEAALIAGLRSACLAADAGRAQLYLVNERALTSHYVWSVPGVRAETPARDGTDVARFGWAAPQLLDSHFVHVPDASALPAEAQVEREALLAQGTCSYLALSLWDADALLGVVDFSRFGQVRPWSAAEIERLRLVADVLAGALRRLRADRERRQAEERLRTIASYAQDTLCEVTLDGRLLYVGDNFDRLLGYPVGTLSRSRAINLVHPDDLAALGRDMLAAASADDGRLLTFRVRHNDGAWRWLEATASGFAATSGEKRLALVLRDVTDRHTRRLELENELALEKKLADFSRELLEISADGIDAGIRHGLGVAAQLAGADRAFLLSSLSERRERPILHSWRREGVAPYPHGHASQGPSYRWVRARLMAGEVVRLSDPGEIQVPEVRREFDELGVKSFLCIPIFAGTHMMGVLGFHCLTQRRDWSDREVSLLRLVADLFAGALRRKQAELGLAESQRRLLQAQKMEAVGTLAGGIAHDFNNQLTVMLANARYALREAPPGSEMHQALGDLARAAEHCAQLTRSLLAFSRRSPVTPTPLEIGAVLGEAEELLRPLIPTSIRLKVSVEDADARISADPTQLQQVLVNLVVNARDAMLPDGGRLDVSGGMRDVSAEEALRVGLPGPGRYAEFAVRDTGGGMDEQVRSRVFEPFYTTKPLGQGTGLGLATAYGIVEQFGGVIAVHSEPGRGSTFRVLLPRSFAVEDELVDVEAALEVTGAGTVLLAEDEAGVRRILARALRDAGYVVIEAPDGAEALRLGRQQLERVDAVVADVDMPRLSGIDLARRLARYRPDLPVLFISGSAPEVIGLGDVDASARTRCFLAKPFSEQHLLERVQELLKR